MSPRNESHGLPTAFEHAEKAPSRFSGLPLRVRLGAVAAVPVIAMGLYVGGDAIDNVDAVLHSEDYQSPDWMDVETYVPGAYGDIIAAAAQEDDVASVALVDGEDEVNVNIFQNGAWDKDSTYVTPFTSMRGMSYGVIASITYGNPGFDLASTTGGFLPVPKEKGSAIGRDLGIESYGENDLEEQALVWHRYINNLAATQWSEHAVGNTYSGATEPREVQELWIKDTIASYLTSLNLQNGEQVATSEQVTQVANVIYSMAVGYDQQSNQTFTAFMELPDTRGRLDQSMTSLVELATRGIVENLVFPDEVQDRIDDAREAAEDQNDPANSQAQ